MVSCYCCRLEVMYVVSFYIVFTKLDFLDIILTLPLLGTYAYCVYSRRKKVRSMVPD